MRWLQCTAHQLTSDGSTELKAYLVKARKALYMHVKIAFQSNAFLQGTTQEKKNSALLSYSDFIPQTAMLATISTRTERVAIGGTSRLFSTCGAFVCESEADGGGGCFVPREAPILQTQSIDRDQNERFETKTSQFHPL